LVIDVLDAILDLIHCANAWTGFNLLAGVVTRLIEDYKLNRRTAQRVAQMEHVPRIGIIR
jgi:hypothetical protein